MRKINRIKGEAQETFFFRFFSCAFNTARTTTLHLFEYPHKLAGTFVIFSSFLPVLPFHDDAIPPTFLSLPQCDPLIYRFLFYSIFFSLFFVFSTFCVPKSRRKLGRTHKSSSFSCWDFDSIPFPRVFPPSFIQYHLLLLCVLNSVWRQPWLKIELNWNCCENFHCCWRTIQRTSSMMMTTTVVVVDGK